MTEDEEDAAIEELKGVLDRRAEMPPGLIARLDAGVTRHERENQELPAETRIIVVCLMFIVIGMGGQGEVLGPETALLLLAIGVAYVLGMRRITFPNGADRGASGPREGIVPSDVV